MRGVKREMNAKQALKAASKHIEDLEDFNQRAVTEIKALNACIDSVIAGTKTFCDWCEEAGECQKEWKEKGAGCSDWWMMLNPPIITGVPVTSISMTLEPGEGSDDSADQSARILSASPDCGE